MFAAYSVARKGYEDHGNSLSRNNGHSRLVSGTVFRAIYLISDEIGSGRTLGFHVRG
jgi:hypothetical protein